ARRDHDGAADAFQTLRDRGVDDPAILFNLAWARAFQKDFASALILLDPSVTSAIPQAAMLDVQLRHDMGEFEEAAARAEQYLAIHPGHPGLAAAVSVLALDVENPELAERCALAAGNHPDALTTLGTLSLGKQELPEAIELFDKALEADRKSPRAWVGRGLAKLISDDGEGAADDIDQGAELFEDHLGSWIAAGWAYLLKHDLRTARARFEKSMAIDHNFAENFGSLAVVDVLEGRLDEARQGIATAFKLDRQCFSAMMAQSLLTSAEGNPDKGQKLFRKILETPINDRGDTALQALARMGLG
ncbi:tetratricopeptide repeat protein, partial [Sphingomonas sp.]|uniref:tetratricopeptide repeat protein n=1 Tax=Sphingomonas sp. TaxID=28214 RepID=UPI0025CD24FC